MTKPKRRTLAAIRRLAQSKARTTLGEPVAVPTEGAFYRGLREIVHKGEVARLAGEIEGDIVRPLVVDSVAAHRGRKKGRRNTNKARSEKKQRDIADWMAHVDTLPVKLKRSEKFHRIARDFGVPYNTVRTYLKDYIPTES